MPETRFDLLIRAGRVVCPASRWDGPGAVAVRDGLILAVGSRVDGAAERSFGFPDALLLPGLIDLHAHPARAGSKYGIDPDVEYLPHGVTTVLSQGDAGATNWLEFREHTIRRSATRVRLAVNLSVRGESMAGGCFENLADVDVDACVAAIEAGGNDVWGIAVNVSRLACGNTDPREVLCRAFQAAERTGRPLLYGMREPADWPLEEQLAALRPGDVLTYCFRSPPCCIVSPGPAGLRVDPAVHEARTRGVFFDVGHGMQSFDFTIAEAALADGFPPDTISSDQYLRHVGSVPPHNLPRTMSKLLAAGMSERDVLAAVTVRPARILGLADEIGTLACGACADLTVLRWHEQAAPLTDARGAQRSGGCWQALLTVRAGKVMHCVES